MLAPPALVVLAAGLGRRYGDDKQTAGVGPGGEWLLEYALHDALAAGFARVVTVVRRDLRSTLEPRLQALLGHRATLGFAVQSPDAVPAGCRVPDGRRKPLGTGHALWCAADLLDGPFAVINADDYYGSEAFRLLAAHFREHDGPAMVGYRLDATLSPHGGVNRGLCDIDADGCLRDVTEYTDISRRGEALTGLAPGGRRVAIDPAATVSLNCWGLTPALLPDLEDGLRAFLAEAGDGDEYYLPHAIADHLARRHRRLRVLPSHDRWLGLTWPDDRPHAVAAIAALHASGRYPARLGALP